MLLSLLFLLLASAFINSAGKSINLFVLFGNNFFKQITFNDFRENTKNEATDEVKHSVCSKRVVAYPRPPTDEPQDFMVSHKFYFIYLSREINKTCF